jgi:Na+-driven multidrug efflux pump
VPALGPAGAGWGLVLSFAVGSVVLFAYLRSGRALVRLPLRETRYEWNLFKDILRVGVPGIANVAINNLAVVILTGIAGHLGQSAAVGYAMGARLEYIMIPLAFGFGTALLAMIGTNWGAKQYQRARRIAWTGTLTVAACCGTVGVFFALLPALWMSLFTTDSEITRIGTLYLKIVAPFYAVYGAGMALYYFMQGVGNIVPVVLANAARLAGSAGGAYAAVTWFDAGPAGVFAAIAVGFLLYGALTLRAFLRTPDPVTQQTNAS